MKFASKLLTAIIFFPFLILGGLIAVAKAVFIATFGLAWQLGDDWHKDLLLKLDEFLQWVKK